MNVLTAEAVRKSQGYLTGKLLFGEVAPLLQVKRGESLEVTNLVENFSFLYGIHRKDILGLSVSQLLCLFVVYVGNITLSLHVKIGNPAALETAEFLFIERQLHLGSDDQKEHIQNICEQ